MPVFDLFLDEKVTVCLRQRVEVEAGTIEEAAQKLGDDLEEAACFDSEFLSETEEYMSPSENGGCATTVIVEQGAKAVLWANATIHERSSESLSQTS